MANDLRFLSASQTGAFDGERIHPGQWAHLFSLLDPLADRGRLAVLDIGGGSGRFADRVLNRYPTARVTVLDS